MIFRKNNLNVGLGLGILVPVVVSTLFNGIVTLGHLPLKLRTIALLGICTNIILMRYFRPYRANESIRGIVIATVALAFLWFFWFYEDIASELNF